MAEVYEAKHELMDRYAAVKLLLPEMSAREIIVRRFLQEAQAAASIEHPGIVHVYDVGYTADGRAYLVMELLHGETLSQRLQRHKRLSLETTVTLMRQLAGVMGAAHQRGIVHRDLKPDNIFLVPDPEMPQGERIKVLDFGLAKLLEGAFPGAELTAQSAIFGTPAYMAPEQCRSSANVDQRADLYAIGCIFYMCLCGRAPFGTGGIEVLMAHVGQAPVPPRQHVPDMPPGIEELILQLLEKEPDRRVPSCETFIAQLDRVVEMLPGGLAQRGARPHANDEVTIRDNPTLQGALAFSTRHAPPPRPGTGGAGPLPGMSDVLPGPGIGAGTGNRDATPAQAPRRAPSAPPLEPTQHLSTQALTPLDEDDNTDRLSVPASNDKGRTGSPATQMLSIDDAELVADDAREPGGEAAGARASRPATGPSTAQAAIHERTTTRLSTPRPEPANETRAMRKQRGPLAETLRVPPRAQSDAGTPVRALPGGSAPADEAPRALPGGSAPADEAPRARHDMPGRSDDDAHAPPPAQAADRSAMRTPVPAMQLMALSLPDDQPSGGSHQPGALSDQGATSSLGSTPTLSNGELEHHPPREPRRKTELRGVWFMAGLVVLGGVVTAVLLLGKSDDPPPVLQAVSSAPKAEAPAPQAAQPEESARLAEIDGLLQRAEEAVNAKDWDHARKLLTEARAREGIDDARNARVTELARRVGAEMQSQEALERLLTAAKKQRMDDVLEALGQIPEGSAFRADAVAATQEAARARAKRLSSRGDCKAAADLVADVARVLPGMQEELQAQSASCVQAAPSDESASGTKGKRDPKLLLQEAQTAYKIGELNVASSICRELKKAGQEDEEIVTICGLTACRTNDLQLAKWYYGRAQAPQRRSVIAQTCLKQGLNVQTK